jgi:cGMP-dependent protein kinase 1
MVEVFQRILLNLWWVQNEKKTYDKANHTFLITGYRTFRDQKNVYFLTEYFPSIELFTVMRDIGILSGSQARFYAASIILALEFLNHRGVIHRDLKPGSILVGADGYMKLTNYGFSAHPSSEKNYRTFTIVGTPHYMAPEVFAGGIGEGYTASVDIWSLGIMLYELLSGKLPFGEDHSDPTEIFELIKHDPLRFPAFFGKNLSSRSFIEQLL